VLEWVLARCSGSATAIDSPVGLLPRRQDLNLAGIDLPAGTVDALLTVDAEGFQAEYQAIGSYLDEFGARLPAALREEHARVLSDLDAAVASDHRPQVVNG
jgi:phosphoenolpyruvate carboxykinase (GTP)